MSGGDENLIEYVECPPEHDARLRFHLRCVTFRQIEKNRRFLGLRYAWTVILVYKKMVSPGVRFFRSTYRRLWLSWGTLQWSELDETWHGHVEGPAEDDGHVGF